MTSVGETLRQERLRRNLDLDQISRELRISTRFLEAIEDEHFDRLPGSVFAKSFVRQYARMLGLNEEELAAEVQRASVPPGPVSTYSEAHSGREEIRVPPVDSWAGGGRRFEWSSSLWALGGVVAVMLICSIVYSWWQRPKAASDTPEPVAQVQEPAQPAPQTAVAPAPVEGSTGTPEQAVPESLAVVPPPVPAPEKASAAPAAAGELPAKAPPAAAATVRVDLTASEPVWVLARADGKYLFSGTLETSETRTVEAAGALVVRFGNAGGVNVSLNGKNLGALGPKGQVRTIQFTSGGFQIVPVAKPPAAPSPSEER
jgi:cytoskeleton protein RodZ